MPRAARNSASAAIRGDHSAGRGAPHRNKSDAHESAQLSDAIATIYDAAIDRERWVDAVEKVTRFAGCFAGALGAADFLHGGLNFGIQWGYAPDVWQRYVEEFYHRNPLNGPAYRTRIGDVRQASNLDTFDELLRSEFYTEWCLPLGLNDTIQGTIDKSASGIAVLTCTHHIDDGPVRPDDIRRMKLVMPHLRRAFLIARLLDLHTVRADAFAEAMDGLSTGVFFINPAGHLVHANAAGQAMIDTNDPVTLSGGHLVTSDHAMLEAMRRACAAALDETIVEETPGVSVGLTGRDGQHFTVHVLPLTSGARKEAVTSSATAVMFVREATVDTAAAIAAANQLYGFTPAESRVLTALVEVGSAAAIPAMLGVARRTVQTHLEHLFEKTGTNRQAELVRLIAGYDTPMRRKA